MTRSKTPATTPNASKSRSPKPKPRRQRGFFVPTPALSIIRAYTHARAREGGAHLVHVLRDFCTNSHEFALKQTKNCRILQKNALFCAESAEKSCNTAIFAL